MKRPRILIVKHGKDEGKQPRRNYLKKRVKKLKISKKNLNERREKQNVEWNPLEKSSSLVKRNIIKLVT